MRTVRRVAKSQSSLAITAAALSAGAGVIHAATVRPQFALSALYGLSFVAFATAQLGWAVWMFVRPTRALALVGVMINFGIAGTWILSRTVGIPVGVEAGVALPVGFPDGAATAFEILAAGACVAFSLQQAASRRSGNRALVGIALAGMTVITVLAVLTQTGTLSFLTPSP